MLTRETVKNYMNTQHVHLTLFSATHNVFLYKYNVDMCALCYCMIFFTLCTFVVYINQSINGFECIMCRAH